MNTPRDGNSQRQMHQLRRKAILLLFTSVTLVNQSCSAQTPEQKLIRSLPPEIRRIVEAAPYDQTIAFAPNSGSCFQVYAIALTWLNARAVLGLEPDPIKALDDLNRKILNVPASAVEPSRAKLVEFDRESAGYQIRGFRLLMLIRLAELLTWSGQKEKAAIALRTARDVELPNEKPSPSVFLEDLAQAFVSAGLTDEGEALVNQLKEDAKKAAFLRNLAELLLRRGDDAELKRIVESLPAREAADIRVRSLVRDGDWGAAWSQIEAIPGGDYYGAKGHLEEALVQRGKGEAALRVARLLLSKTPTYGSPSPQLLRLLVAEGAVDEALALAEKIPDINKTYRTQPYAAAAVYYRKQGHSERAAELLQNARKIAVEAFNADTELCLLAKILREGGMVTESSRIQDEAITRLSNNDKSTTTDFIWVVQALIDMGEKEKAVVLLRKAVQKLGASPSCKNRAEIAYQYARMQRWDDARQTTEICMGSELKAGSGIDEAWRLYGDAFTIFQYSRSVSADFRAGFHTYYYNNIFLEVWFKLNSPFFWGD